MTTMNNEDPADPSVHEQRVLDAAQEARLDVRATEKISSMQKDAERERCAERAANAILTEEVERLRVHAVTLASKK